MAAKKKSPAKKKSAKKKAAPGKPDLQIAPA
jgi:hypothetical protein